jgi:myo-inositol-1(or 4)-monophosphatase
LASSDFDPGEPGRFLAIVQEAGAIAMRYFRPGDQTGAKVMWKGDGSPVTEADFAVNAYLETNLRALWPEAAWLSEESADNPARLGARQVIIVDPIDGTRGFARGDNNWCVAVALVEAGRPVQAVVHAPANSETFTAHARGGALLNGTPISIPHCDTLRPDLRVSAPASVVQDLRDAGIELDFRPKIASLALRITGVASGDYDGCLATRDSNDWDLAAADLVLQEAGGLLAGADGQSLIYNRAGTRHGALIATARALQPKFLEAFERAKAARG